LDLSYDIPDWITLDSSTFELVVKVPHDASHAHEFTVGVQHGTKTELVTLEIFNCDPVENVQYLMWDGYSDPLYR
jgi:hypothetical protein